MLNGGVIGLPPVLNYGSPELQAKVVPEVLSGKKYISLAISEAFAGSDVSGIQTTAVRDGDDWIVTGTKKCAGIFHACVCTNSCLGGSLMEPFLTTSLLDAERR